MQTQLEYLIIIACVFIINLVLLSCASFLISIRYDLKLKYLLYVPGNIHEIGETSCMMKFMIGRKI